MRLGVACLGLTLLLAAGCAPRGEVRPTGGRPVDPAPLVAALDRYNAGPRQVRLAGVFRARGRGTARFGARAAEGVGLRMDAAAGPFGTPLFALACVAGEGCLVLVPGKRRAYELAGPEGVGWLEALLRGRVPVLGPVTGAWETPGGERVLRMERGDWVEEVSLAGNPGTPRRLWLLQEGRVRLRVAWEGERDVAGHPFPLKLRVETAEPPERYEIEFRQVEPARGIRPEDLRLALPPGVSVQRMEGAQPWSSAVPPFWLPIPEG